MTAAAPSPSESRRPLGEVLVERGIVTPEQLTTALERQRSTGQQLGEIIVALGFAPGPIVAQALATQHGGLIKTEYGFATPWSKSDAPAPVAAVAPADTTSELAERNRTIAELRAWAQKAQAAIAARDEAIARLRADLAEQRSAPEPVVDAAHEEALEALRAELAAESERHRSTQAQVEANAAEVARLEAALATPADVPDEETLAALRGELDAESERHRATQAQLETDAAEVARLEATLADLNEAAALHETELAAAKAEQTTSEYELAAARRTNDELERRLQNARTRAETLARRIAEQDDELEAFRSPTAAKPSRWASAPMHYVLQRGTGAYDLVAHEGPPPAVGDMVDGMRVARVAPAGPGFDVPCAYLAD